MDLGAVGHWKSAILSLKRKKQIRAAEDDGLGALSLAQVLPDREECASLRIRDATRDRHLDVVLVDLSASRVAIARTHVVRALHSSMQP